MSDMSDLKEHFKNQFEYNRYAWSQIFGSVEQLPDEDYKQDRGFFWGSIHGMLVHGMAAESIWLSRSMGVSPSSLFAPAAFADFKAVVSMWETVDLELRAFVATCDLGKVISYQNTKGTSYQMTQADILQHVLFHGMEHRSQLTPILYELEVATKPMDYLYWVLEKGGGQNE